MNLALSNMGMAKAMPNYADILASMNSLTPGGGIGGGLTGATGMFNNVPIGLGGDTTFASMGAPGGGMAGGGGMSGLDIANAGIAGLQTIANIWGSFQAQKMAKKQFKFTKQMTRANLANQVKSYNTALADRARSRGYMEGQTQDQIDAYVRNNSLHTSAKGHQTAGASAAGGMGGNLGRLNSLAATAVAAAAARGDGGSSGGSSASRNDDDESPSNGG